MPTAPTNGIELAYETFGQPTDPALLLIMGLGAQLIAWDEEFCRQLAGHGFHVIRFDNRDVGLSTKLDDAPVPDLAAALGGDVSGAPYTLDDMADDAAGLLDHLGVGAAHVVGASMGGMIAQTLAIRHPDRVRSLCSIMSTTGDRSVGQATPEAMAILLQPRPTTADEAAERAAATAHVIGSKGLPVDLERVRRLGRAAFERCFHPAGFLRQLVAILAHGDRTPALRQLDVPTVVIHGTDDTLVQPDGGEATAKAIPGAELVIVEGMGHDLPPAAWPTVIGAIVANARRAG